MLTAEENTRLNQVGPGTPCGELMRCYWHPLLLSKELPKPDCPPVRVRFLGEDFVAFRNTEGKVGIVEDRCPHRGVELYWGRNEESGLRCVFHGWKFTVNGECIDMPNTTKEAAERMKPRCGVKAFDIVEKGGAIWGRLPVSKGKETRNEIMQLPFMHLPDSHIFISKYQQNTNWSHPLEGAIDTSHFTFLHGPVPKPEKKENENPSEARYRWIAEDGTPTMNLIHHDAGMAIGAARKADEDALYWRITQFLMPDTVLPPSAFKGENNFGSCYVPQDDENCWVYNFVYNLERPLTDKERAHYGSGGGGGCVPTDENFIPLLNPGNQFNIDRKWQASNEPYSFTGIKGVRVQDALVQYSQGTMHDRTREILVQTDRAVVEFRKLVLNAVTELEKGKLPVSVKNHKAYRVGSGDSVSASDAKFEDVLIQRFGSPTGLLPD